MRKLFAAALALGLISCGPPPVKGNPCCTPTSVKRDFGYAGTYVGDAGVSTQVQVIVNAAGIATVSFVRNGDQVVETFQTSIR